MSSWKRCTTCALNSVSVHAAKFACYIAREIASMPSTRGAWTGFAGIIEGEQDEYSQEEGTDDGKQMRGSLWLWLGIFLQRRC